METAWPYVISGVAALISIANVFFTWHRSKQTNVRAVEANATAQTAIETAMEANVRTTKTGIQVQNMQSAASHEQQLRDAQLRVLVEGRLMIFKKEFESVVEKTVAIRSVGGFLHTTLNECAIESNQPIRFKKYRLEFFATVSAAIETGPVMPLGLAKLASDTLIELQRLFTRIGVEIADAHSAVEREANAESVSESLGELEKKYSYAMHDWLDEVSKNQDASFLRLGSS